MIEDLPPVLGSHDEHAEVVTDALLAAVLLQGPGPQAALDVDVVCRKLAGHAAAPRLEARVIGKEVLVGSLPHHEPPPKRLSA